MDWKECVIKLFVKEARKDEGLINSLINSSSNKLKSSKRLELDSVTASTKISISYESLRELLEALAIKKGFKIYNHECFGSFLSEICKEESFSKEFDKFRKIRNQINYYGREIPLEDAEKLIKNIIFLRTQIMNKYLAEF